MYNDTKILFRYWWVNTEREDMDEFMHEITNTEFIRIPILLLIATIFISQSLWLKYFMDLSIILQLTSLAL